VPRLLEMMRATSCAGEHFWRIGTYMDVSQWSFKGRTVVIHGLSRLLSEPLERELSRTMETWQRQKIGLLKEWPM